MASSYGLSAGCDVGEHLWNVVAVQVGEALHGLHAAAMAMHVAEAANIHQNVEAQLVAGREGTRQLIMATAMARAEQEQLLAPRRIERSNVVANLAVGIVAGAVEQRGDDFNLDRFALRAVVRLHQVDERRWLDGAVSMKSCAACSSSIRDFWMYSTGAAYFTSVGAICDVAQQQGGGPFAQRRIGGGNVSLQFFETPRVAHSSKGWLPPRAASRRDGEPPREVATSSRETCVSRVRALTISPSEVFAASGNR